MTVLELQRAEVPQFLMTASHRVAAMEPKSVFGYLGDCTCGVFVTSCDLRIGLDDEPEFAVQGVTFDGLPTSWTGRVDDISIRRLEDAGYIFTAGLKPTLTLYL